MEDGDSVTCAKWTKTFSWLMLLFWSIFLSWMYFSKIFTIDSAWRGYLTFFFFELSSFFIFVFLFSMFYLLFSISSNFWLSYIFFMKIFSRTLLYLKKNFQVPIIIFNQKALVNISRISYSKNPPRNLVEFCTKFLILNVQRIVGDFF